MSNKPSSLTKRRLLPQEERLEVVKQRGKMLIGVPRETHYQEKRVCVTPDNVSVMTSQGHQFLIETNAGKDASFSDKDYAEAGAEIVYDTQKVFQCPIVLKVEPPSLKEISFMREGSLFFSALQLKTQKKEYIEALMSKKISAIAYDFIKDEQGEYPIVKSLSEIAGVASVLIASELMSGEKGNGLLFGNISGVKPAKLVVLGAGTVAESVIKSAIGLGVSVKVFDKSVGKLRNLQHNVGRSIYTSTIQPKELQKALMRCDVAIGAIRGKTRAPILVTEDMVKNMKENSVIVDVSIDRGGCFETSELTTHSQPTFVKHGVIHYGVPNIPSRYPKTASISMSNILIPYLISIADEGGFENSFRNMRNLRKGMYLYKGILTHKNVADWFDMPFTNVDLLFL